MVPHRFQKGNCGSNLGLKSNPCFTKPWDNTNFESTTWCQTPRCEAIPSKQTMIACIIKGNHPVQNSLSCVWQTQQHPKGKQQKKTPRSGFVAFVLRNHSAKKDDTLFRWFGDWHGLASLSRSWRPWHFEPTILDLTVQRVYIDFSFWRFPQFFPSGVGGHMS